MGNTKIHIPWAKPNYWGNEVKYVNEAVESTWISGGRFLDELEARFSTIFEKKHVLAVSNGTTAIQLAFLALDLKPQDEIIVPGFSFMAAANIATQMGIKPVFAEVDPDTWCISPENLSRLITPKTKAIIPIHTYGNVCDMDGIMSVANKYGIHVIEDCAESLFSKYKSKFSGTFGKINTFSFQATKTITTGEGGLVVTDSEELKNKMALYRSHGMDRNKRYYWHELAGHNFRLTNLQAALGVAQLEKKDAILSGRKKVFEEYRKRLLNVEGISLQKIEKNVDPVIWAFAVKLNPESFSQNRDKIMEILHEKGIETRPGFYASSLLTIYDKHSLTICEDISKNVLSLPFFPTLKNEEISFICDELLKFKR